MTTKYIIEWPLDEERCIWVTAQISKYNPASTLEEVREQHGTWHAQNKIPYRIVKVETVETRTIVEEGK